MKAPVSRGPRSPPHLTGGCDWSLAGHFSPLRSCSVTADVSIEERVMFEWYLGLAREIEIRHDVEKLGWIRNELAILEKRKRGRGL